MEPWNLRRYTREIIAQSESPLQDVSFLKEYFCGMLHGVEDSYVKRSLAIQELALKTAPKQHSSLRLLWVLVLFMKPVAEGST